MQHVIFTINSQIRLTNTIFRSHKPMTTQLWIKSGVIIGLNSLWKHQVAFVRGESDIRYPRKIESQIKINKYQFTISGESNFMQMALFSTLT